MHKLIWNELDERFECSKCGERYNMEEIARAFDYTGEINIKYFVPIYCMGCGTFLKTYKK